MSRNLIARYLMGFHCKLNDYTILRSLWRSRHTRVWYEFRMRSARSRSERSSWGRNTLRVERTASTAMRMRLQARPSQSSRQLSLLTAKTTSRRIRLLSRSRNRSSWLQRLSALSQRPNCSRCRRWRSILTHRTKVLWRSLSHHVGKWLAISSTRRPKTTSKRIWWWWESV